MRICIINEFFYPDDTGGTGTVLSDLAAALRRDYGDVEIDVVTSDKLYRDKAAVLPAFEEWDGIRIFRLGTPHPGGLSTVKRLAVNFQFGCAALAKLLRLGRYDLLLVGTAPPTVAMAADWYNALTRTPYLYVVYDLEPDRAITMGLLGARNPVAVVLRRFQRRWLHAAGRVIVLGRCMQAHVGRTYGLPPDRIEGIAIGCDAASVLPGSKATPFRARHGLDGFVVCYSGNFGRYHDFDTILDAAKALRARRPDVTFVLVGGGAQKERIVRRVEDEGIANVRVLPFVPKNRYSELLASADVSLVTLEEGMEGLCVPSKFYSILASGRPTIALASPASEVSRVIAESDCGVQIAQGDTERLVEVIAGLAESPRDLARMGENARAVLVERYSTREVARRYYEAMCGVLDRSVEQGAGAREAPSGDAPLATGGRQESLAAFAVMDRRQ